MGLSTRKSTELFTRRPTNRSYEARVALGIDRDPDAPNTTPTALSSIITNAFESGNREMIQEALRSKVKPDLQTLQAAFQNKNTNQKDIDKAIEQGAEVGKFDLTAAFQSGNPILVQKALDIGAQPDQYTLTAAFSNIATTEEHLSKAIDLGAKADELTLTTALGNKNPELKNFVRVIWTFPCIRSSVQEVNTKLSEVASEVLHPEIAQLGK